MDPKTMDTQHNRIKVLDGFRGLAILLVVGYHYYSFFSFGWVGVDLFFVLSGFLITGKLAVNAGSKNYYINFYRKRFLRIVPLYYLILIFFFLLVPMFWPSLITSSYQQMIKEQAWYWSFSVNFYNAIYGWTDSIIFVPLWSIACEIQYYLIWPLLCSLLFRKQQWAIGALIGLAAFALIFRLFAGGFFSLQPEFRYVLLPARIDSFSIGALLYFFSKEAKYHWMLHKGWLLAAACLTAAVAMMIVAKETWQFGSQMVSRYGYTMNALFWAGVMGATLQQARGLVQFFQARWLVAAGKYSYGVYLLHVPVKVLVVKWFKNHAPAASIHGQLLLSLLLTAGLAFLSYYLLEKRLLNYKRVSIK
ncbi:MAG: acyltransferase [Chitinophagaceae bacterium]